MHTKIQNNKKCCQPFVIFVIGVHLIKTNFIARVLEKWKFLVLGMTI